jgi:hypothetical protein
MVLLLLGVVKHWRLKYLSEDEAPKAGDAPDCIHPI